MIDLIMTLAVLLVGGVLFGALVQRSQSWEQPLLGLSFIAHAVSAVAMILLTVHFFGGGDMLAYHRHGLMHAVQLDMRFMEHAPDLLRYTLRRPTLGPRLFMGGSSTGAMIGLSGWMSFALGGSLYAICMVFAVAGFFSKYLTYVAFKLSLPERYHKAALVAAMLIPSVVFWSCALLKEPVAMLGLGPAVWGVAHLARGERRLIALIAVGLGAVPIGVIKPYVLFPFLMCAVIWIYWHRALKRRSGVGLLAQPLYIGLAVALLFGAMQLLSMLFPEYSVAQVADEAAQLQKVGQRIKGGSHYAIASAPTRSLAGQLLLAPIGLSFSLFRPLPFDVRNPAILLNALEMLWLIALWFKMFKVRPWRQSLKMVMTSPLLVFCVGFCVIFGAAVGVSSTNIGTLSRYRVPMMPFYTLALLVLAGQLQLVTGGARQAVAKRAVTRAQLR